MSSTRNIFLSFLGTSAYQKATYLPLRDDEPPTGPHRFIQAARVEALLGRGVRLNRVVTLLTLDAKRDNWRPAERRGRDGRLIWENEAERIPYRGLFDVLTGLGVEPDYVMVRDGKSADELWENFGLISDLVEPGDALYVDITHGYRSLETVLMMALDYVTRAKGATLAEVSYGAFEARTPEGTPTFDITPFLAIREWSSALVQFNQAGDLRALGDVMQANSVALSRILRQKMPPELGKVGRALSELGSGIELNRMRVIAQRAELVATQLDAATNDVSRFKETRPLSLVLQRLQERIGTLVQTDQSEEAQIRAQLNAAAWTAQHGLFIQAFSLMRESAIDIIWLPANKAISRTEAEALYGAMVARSAPRLGGLSTTARALFELLTGDAEFWKPFGEALTKVKALRNPLHHCGVDNSKALSHRFDRVSSTKKLTMEGDSVLKDLREALVKVAAMGALREEEPPTPCRAFILMNHTLSGAQTQDLRDNWGIENVVLPERALVDRWASLDPTGELDATTLKSVYDWLTDEANPGDLLLIQGEFGATFAVVNKALELGLIPVYATSMRDAVETLLPDGSVKVERRFKHVQFRRYAPDRQR